VDIYRVPQGEIKDLSFDTKCLKEEGKIQKNIVEDTKKVAFHVKSDSTVGQGKSTDGRERFRWSAVEEGVST
jgi:hypothetical protein